MSYGDKRYIELLRESPAYANLPVCSTVAELIRLKQQADELALKAQRNTGNRNWSA